MSPYEVIAFLLLSAPTQVTVANAIPDDWIGYPTTCLCLRAKCLELELIKPEDRTFLYLGSPIGWDLWSMRYEFQRQAKLPNLRAAEQRFKWAAPFAKANVEFADRYIARLYQRLDVEKDREELIRTVITEAEALRDVWNCVSLIYNRDANDGEGLQCSKEDAIAALAELIDADAFADGVLPDYVPTWRFDDLSR